MTPGEKLKEWQKDTGRSVVWIANQLNARRATVHSWMNGSSKPIRAYRAAIETLTDGAVSAQEWGK